MKRNLLLILVWVALLATQTLFSCKKEPKPQRHKDYMRAEFDGNAVDLTKLVCIINNQGLLDISGEYDLGENNAGSILVSICNLPNLPYGSWPLTLDTNCISLPSKRSNTLFKRILEKAFIVISEQDDGYSRITLESFSFEGPQKFEAKGTFQFKGIQVNEFQSPPYPEKIVTGSFHFKYPPN